MDPVVDLTIRIGLALLLGAAAVHKLGDLPAFRATLAEYRLLPLGLTTAAAASLVVIESLTAVGVLLPALADVALVGAAALLTAYAAAIGINLARGRRDLDCGCFGAAARRPIHGGLVGRNVMLATLAIGARTPVTTRPLAWVDVMTIVTALATLTALHLALDQLLAEAPRLRALRGDG